MNTSINIVICYIGINTILGTLASKLQMITDLRAARIILEYNIAIFITSIIYFYLC